MPVLTVGWIWCRQKLCGWIFVFINQIIYLIEWKWCEDWGDWLPKQKQPWVWKKNEQSEKNWTEKLICHEEHRENSELRTDLGWRTQEKNWIRDRNTMKAIETLEDFLLYTDLRIKVRLDTMLLYKAAQLKKKFWKIHFIECKAKSFLFN